VDILDFLGFKLAGGQISPIPRLPIRCPWLVRPTSLIR